MRTLTKEMQASLTPKQALQLLIDGNKRFVENIKMNRNLLQQVNETADGQYPFAVVLSCIDSRAPVELIFDQGLGDVFSVRIAGNVINEDILGSMEFATKVAGSKLIMVLGHTKCGAVKGACDNVKMGHLTHLLEKIAPAVEAEKRTEGTRSSENEEFVHHVTEINVFNTMMHIPEVSPIIKEMLDKKEIALVGGLYNLDSGVVEFYDTDEIKRVADKYELHSEWMDYLIEQAKL